jgi:hypothetical protein
MKRVSRSLLRAVIALTIVGISALPAYAATSSGLSITPRADFILKPGQTVTDNLQVSNLNNQLPLNLSLRVVDFTFLNNSGAPKLFLSPNTPQTTWSLKSFITMPKTISLGGGQTEEIPVTIKIPPNQGAGSYYSAIDYVASANNSSNVNLNASGVSLIFVTVSGKANENMSLQGLGAYVPDNSEAGGHYASILTSPPAEIGYTLTNKGNITESPVGAITLVPMYGKHDIGIGNANTLSSLALIGQTRQFTVCIQSEKQSIKLNGVTTTTTVCNPKPHLQIGRYTIKLDIFYGQPGKTTHEVTGVATFWYIPLWFIASVFAVIIVIVFGIIYLIRKVRKYLKVYSAK